VRSNVREDVDDEIAYHLEMRTRELMDAGLDEPSAREEALRHFGNRRRVERELLALGERRERLTHRAERLDAMWATVRYALRRIRRAPGFSLAVVLTFALGIGANAVMFGIVDRLLLSPPAHVDDPGTVHLLMTDYSLQDRRTRDTSSTFSYPDYLDFTRAGSFIVAAISGGGPLTFGSGPEARQLDRQLVSGSFFSLLGVRPALGRFFGPEDDVASAEGVAVISYSLWRNDYGRDPAVLGRTLDFGSGPYTIVGVAPPGFNGVELREVDLWLPMVPVRTAQGSAASLSDRHEYRLQILARRARGVSPERMAAEAGILHRQGRAEEIASGRYAGDVRILAPPLDPAEQGGLSGAARVAGWLLGISGLVLLIACANVANLLLARSTSREREMVVRAAVGADRWRLVRQLLTESAVLGVLAAALGVWLARLGVLALKALGPADLPRLEEVSVDAVALAFAVGTALLCSVAFGIMPALQVSSVNLVGGLRQGGKGSSIGSRGAWARSAFVIAEIALAVVLVFSAGLLARSLIALSAVEMGFVPEQLLVLRTVVPVRSMEDAKRAVAFYRDAMADVRAVPGVTSAGAVTSLPTAVRSNGGYWIEGGPGPEDQGVRSPQALFIVTTSDYFRTMRIPMKRGRDFSELDTADAQFVAVINESLARASFPNGDPIGKRIRCGLDSLDYMTIVGVVADVRTRGPASPIHPEIYMPHAQHPGPGSSLNIVVRSDAADPLSLGQTISRKLRDRNPDVPVRISTMQGTLDTASATPRFRAFLLTSFATIALALAIAGVYGVMAYSVSQRLPEMGVRVALGATPSRILSLVLGQGVKLAAAGLAIGLGLCVLAGRLLQGLLFGVTASDPTMLVFVVLAVTITTLLACTIPGRRAIRVDPMVALRAE
jgi:predicted permease